MSASKSKSAKSTVIKDEEKKTTKPIHKQISMREHVLTKSMWAGAKAISQNDYYVLDNNKLTLKTVEYPPVLLKLVDEILVNAIDHYTNHPAVVTKIDISLDNTGQISITNDGLGIPIQKTKNLQGTEMYNIQMIFSEFMTGSNLDANVDRVVGGTNGLGAKLVGVFSDFFQVETYDVESKTYYKQMFKDSLQVIEPPMIITSMDTDFKKLKAAQKVGHTTITFLPMYKLFTEQDKPITFAKIKDSIENLIKSRVYLAAVGAPIKFTFTGTNKTSSVIQFKTFAQACDAFANENTLCSFDIPHEKYPWKVAIGLSDGKSRQVSIVNGLVMLGGPHIQHIQNQLIAALKPKIEKEIKKFEGKFNKNILLNNLFIIMVGNIPNIDPAGQTKETFAYDIKKFAPYVLSDTIIQKIWKEFKDFIMNEYYAKQSSESKTKANRKRIDASEYTEARLSRTANRGQECSLIIAEGDSAIGTANAGLVSKRASPNFNYDYFGLYSIQGVSINGLKSSIELGKKRATKKPAKSTTDKPSKSDKSTEEKKAKPKKSKKQSNDDDNDGIDDIDGINGDNDEVFEETKSKTFTVPTTHIPRRPKQRVINNKRLSVLFKVLNLDFAKTYEKEEEWKTLRYGSISALVDQDLDGFNIFGLIATLILTYWPKLVERGFVRRINTPLIRYYPKNKSETVKEFYTEKQVNQWIEEVGQDHINATYKLPPNYYKGLGSHDPGCGEIDSMFRNINEKICTYILDAKAIESMYIYYGSDSLPRKVVLATPVTYEPVEGLQVPLSQHFHIDTKLYQRDNILRKLINLIDGFISSRRKVFFTALKVASAAKKKVAGLAADTVSVANYHHGESSIASTIVHMAQAYQGARHLPLLLPLGMFGTRDQGFKNAASSRYIYTQVNTKIANKLFRKEDNYILQYEMEDGERYEPKYYVPIIPYALCENNAIPGTGWRMVIYARDINHIIKNVRDMIQGKIKKCRPLPMSRYSFVGEIREVKNTKYFMGKYEYNPETNIVHITELPFGVCSKSYIDGSEDGSSGIKYKEYVEDVNDLTNFDGVNIEIYLKTGAYDLIEEKYGDENFSSIESYFELKREMKDYINLVNQHDEVVEYERYEDIFDDWFVFRKDLYAKRVERELIINDLKIRMLENQQRFSQAHASYKITKDTEIPKFITILTENKYDIFNKTLLEQPKYTDVDSLKLLITSAEHGADYSYLIGMSYYELSNDGYRKRTKQLEELKERQRYLLDPSGAFKGAKIWELELAELEKNIIDGMATGWFYGENKYNFDGDTTTVVKPKVIRKRKA